MSTPAYPRGTADRLFGPVPSTLDVLRSVYALIRSPDRYTATGYALRADGGVCSESAPEAARWSLHGAIWRACPQVSKAAGERRAEVIAMLDEAAREVGIERIEVAMQRGHSLVIALVQRAGERARVAA